MREWVNRYEGIKLSRQRVQGKGGKYRVRSLISHSPTPHFYLYPSSTGELRVFLSQACPLTSRVWHTLFPLPELLCMFLLKHLNSTHSLDLSCVINASDGVSLMLSPPSALPPIKYELRAICAASHRSLHSPHCSHFHTILQLSLYTSIFPTRLPGPYLSVSRLNNSLLNKYYYEFNLKIW